MIIGLILWVLVLSILAGHLAVDATTGKFFA